MISLLTKSAICMAVLLAVYYLLLEKEKMHRFNRFYLLFSLVFSLILPFISITIYTGIETEAVILPPPVDIAPASVAPPAPPSAYLTTTIWAVYMIMALVLAIRFGSNIYRLYKKAASCTIVNYNNAKLVLLEQETVPYTFLNYLFINKTAYNSGSIEEELYTHELAHINQKHTYDLLLIEVLKVVFWFNPLLYFYKKAIRLNHEFLADEAVNSLHKNIRVYQMLLLSKAAPANTLYPASNLTFSLTKKRLIMMSKSTTPLVATLTKLVVAPVVAALVSMFCIETKIKPQEVSYALAIPQPGPQEKNGPVTVDEYFAGVRFIAYEYGVQSKNEIKGRRVIIDKRYEDLTNADKEYFKPFMIVPKPYVKKAPTAAEFKDFSTNTKKYAIWIDGLNVPNSKLNNYKPTDIAHFSGSVILKNARTKKHPQPFQYWFYTHKGFDDAKLGVQRRHYEGDKVTVMSRIDKV